MSFSNVQISEKGKKFLADRNLAFKVLAAIQFSKSDLNKKGEMKFTDKLGKPVIVKYVPKF